MGHKVPPLANRLGYTKTWISRWYSKRQNFGVLLMEDEKIRLHIKKTLNNAAIAKIEIERTLSKVRVIIHTARPGIIIGRRGADIDRLREDLHRLTNRELVIDIREVKNPAIEPQLIAENIAFQLERQVTFRRAMKRAVQLAMNSGAKGVKVRCAGRLGGAEMSRVESYRDGKIPLGTFRADIEYGFAVSRTTYGAIGVKSWIYKEEPLSKQEQPVQAAAAAAVVPTATIPVPPAEPVIKVD